MHAAVPSGLRLSSESKIQLNPNFDREESKYPLDFREEKILEALEKTEEISYEDCEKILGVKTIHPILKSLVAKEAILVYEKVLEKYTPKVETRIRLTGDIASNKTALEAVFEAVQGKPKQESILLKYLRDIPVFQKPQLNEKGVDKATLLEEGDSESSLKTLIKNGIFESFKVVLNRLPEEEPEKEPAQLSTTQQVAFEEIKTHFESKQTVLLHGVTGSGKTEVYLHSLAHVLARGEGGMFLVPEIALTPQMLRRCRAVFGDAVAVLHSELSAGEYRDEWDRIRDGVARVVEGTLRAARPSVRKLLPQPHALVALGLVTWKPPPIMFST
jgi:primosomal protein N' (replication factor Y)